MSGAGGAHITGNHWGVTLGPSVGGDLVGTCLSLIIAGKSVQTEGGLIPKDVCHLAGNMAHEC